MGAKVMTLDMATDVVGERTEGIVPTPTDDALPRRLAHGKRRPSWSTSCTGNWYTESRGKGAAGRAATLPIARIR